MTNYKSTLNNVKMCQLCAQKGWKGRNCPTCENFKQFHYVEGIGADTKTANCFCIAESPIVPNLSADVTGHIGWSYDIEKSIKSIYENYQKYTSIFNNASCRFTYAIHCEKDKPSNKEISACSALFHTELDQYCVENKPIVVLALGAVAVRLFDIKHSGYKKIQGKILTTNYANKTFYIIPTVSKRQILQNPGMLGILKKHMYLFLSTVHNVQTSRPVATITPIDTLITEHVYPDTLDKLKKITEEIINYAPEGNHPDTSAISIDTETNTLFPHRKKLKLLTLVVSWEPGKAVSIPVEHAQSPFKLVEVAPYIQEILSCKKPKILHNAKFDMLVLRRKGWEINNIAWDTMVGEHLLEESKKGYYGLKELVHDYLPAYSGYEEDTQQSAHPRTKDIELETDDEDENIENTGETTEETTKKNGEAKKKSRSERRMDDDKGYAHVPLEILNQYGALDADVTRRIAPIQRQRIRQEQALIDKKRREHSGNAYFRLRVRPLTDSKEPLFDLMKYQMIPVIKTLTNIESKGIRVDQNYVNTLIQEMTLSLHQILISIYAMIPAGMEGTKFNPGSTQQIRDRLFSSGYIHPQTSELICYKGKITPPQTQKGAISTNAKFLRELVTQHSCVFSKAILDYRAILKAKNTFLENIKILSADDGRMHTTFHPHGTATGRLCVSGDTILNTDKGSFVISKLDLTQIPNIHVLTHTNKMQQIKKVFYKGQEEMYRVELENTATIDVTKNHRFFTPSGVYKLQELDIGSYVTTLSNYKNTFNASRIKSIQYVGIKDVWDIEVENDHSFVAQGFVNHNSSSQENMQNIPTKIGTHNIKRCFIPTNPENEVFVQADAKAAEVRVYAAYSRDANLIKALNDGMDPHSYFSSMILNPQILIRDIPHSDKKRVLEIAGIDDEHSWTYSDFEARDQLVGTKEKPGPNPAYGIRLNKLRNNIKRVVFGILYGAYKTKIASIIGIPENQAQTIIDSLFKMFPTIQKYMDQTKEQLGTMFMVETFFGRRRRFPDWAVMTSKMRNQAERKAINFKIQSTTSDIVMRTMTNVENPLLKDYNAHIVLTVHDSICWEMPKKYVSQMPDFIKEHFIQFAADNYPWMPVPFKWDISVGPSYGELTPFAEYTAAQIKPESALQIERKEIEYLETEIRQELATTD